MGGKYGKGASIRRGTVDRLRLAMGQNPQITIDREGLDKTEGYTEDYLVMLGLTKADLKRLERARLAVRGYMPTPSGHRVRWVLVRPEIGQL